MKKHKYNIVPGRGLVTQKAIDIRSEYLRSLGFEIDKIVQTSLNHVDIQNNIESFIGSVEVPVGIVGPLTYHHNNTSEEVYTLAGTLEGALVASMNRGAKAISMSGGYGADVLRQRMLRSPSFRFDSKEDAGTFWQWVKKHFEQIKEVAESYSNHAVLQDLEIIADGEFVHVKFIYTTGDASGQNMTTTCTWHAILWLVATFEKASGIKITDFVLEGNGASDKKVSQYLIDRGRGIQVVTKCTINEDVLKKVLRTNAAQMVRFFSASKRLADKDGMLGYNINVANAIAAIFVATGQDLASIHESSLADLKLVDNKGDLEVELTLHSLVIGTLGGGTHLPKQQEALKIMKCDGQGKIKRFASLIAGFVMGLEISTLAAIASGEFAKAHEKLGRNRPHDWLRWREIDFDFVYNITRSYLDSTYTDLELLKGDLDNGILMTLSKRVNSKLTGFIPLKLKNESGEIELVIKSKALDLEVIKGLHLMAASIDPELSDLLFSYKDELEYSNSHVKELLISEALHGEKLNSSPRFYGIHIDIEREAYMLFQERLQKSEMLLMDSENKPEKWKKEYVYNAIDAITKIHQRFNQKNEANKLQVKSYEFSKAIPLYKKTISILVDQYESANYDLLYSFIEDLENYSLSDQGKCLIHNDYNPRNVAIRKDGSVCIYDWELAVWHYPQRDIVELLSFVLKSDFSDELLLDYLKYHFKLANTNQKWSDWKKIYVLMIKEYVVSRVSFYKTAEILMKLKFVDRVYENCLRMIEIIELDESV